MQIVCGILTYDTKAQIYKTLMAVSVLKDKFQMARMRISHRHLMARLNKCKTEVTEDDDVCDKVSQPYTSLLVHMQAN